jgi:S-DNA-T family DNA segregation ATPase FtsK/SpoIIIE
LIEETLRQFGLEAKVVRVSQGPAVTQFGVEPGYVDRPGTDGEVRKQKVRVSQISSLSNDLALALAAPSLRIEAPVPGQSFVGIEVPNDKIAMVGLRGVMDSNAFRKVSSRWLYAGQDVSGAAVAGWQYAAHLIAGTTGSGRACINAIVMSLIANLYAGRFAAGDDRSEDGGVDRYNGLPHLYGKGRDRLEHRDGATLGDARWMRAIRSLPTGRAAFHRIQFADGGQGRREIALHRGDDR